MVWQTTNGIATVSVTVNGIAIATGNGSASETGGTIPKGAAMSSAAEARAAIKAAGLRIWQPRRMGRARIQSRQFRQLRRAGRTPVHAVWRTRVRGEHGYSGRETGGGMSLYSSAPERERYSQGAGMGNYYESRGEDRERFERDRGERQRFEGRDRDREEWGREWGGQGFSGREGGWGGYGSYDRERGGWERASAGYDRDRGHTEMWRGRGGESWEHGRPGEEFRREYSAGRNYGGYGSYGAYSGQGTRWNEGQNWGERGRFMGRGPRNWQRSDERIKEDINERLTEHPDIDASDIEVEVVAGEVTLRGKVDDRHAKRLAEDIAEGVFGVRDVRNEIKVSRGFFGAISDAITGRSDEDDRERERRETTSAAQRGVTAGTSTGTGSSSGNVTGNSSSAQKQGDLTGAKK